MFWKTIKPYLSKKNNSSNSKIILEEENKLITDQREVTEIFNNFFANVADGIGKGVTFDENNHPSVCKIKENFEQTELFTFSYIDKIKVSKYMDKLHVKTATGADKISGKILKLAKPALLSP